MRALAVLAALGAAGVAIGAGPAPKPAHGAAPWAIPSKGNFGPKP